MEITENHLRELLENLRKRGFDQKGVSIRIGYDEKGMALANALRGKSHAKLQESYALILEKFAGELGVEAPSVVRGETVNLQTLNSKLDRILLTHERILSLLENTK